MTTILIVATAALAAGALIGYLAYLAAGHEGPLVSESFRRRHEL